MNQPEICLNLWYIRDEEEFIYSLRARTYAALFEDAIKTLQAELPSQTSLNIPDAPLIYVTPLFSDDNGNIYPKVNKTAPFNNDYQDFSIANSYEKT